MKIYRKNVCVNLELSEFVDILESEMLDELLLFIMELDDSAAPASLGPGYLKTAKPLENIPLPSEVSGEEYVVDSVEEMVGMLMEMIGDGDGEIEVHYYEIDGDDFDQDQMGDLDGDGYLFYDTSDDYELTEEDKKVRRLINRYRSMVK